MLTGLLQRFRTYPVTVGLIFLSSGLFAADVTLSVRFGIPFFDAQTLLGAINMTWLWDGAWWTVVTTALHHGDIFHLLFNMFGLWRLGSILERRGGSFYYGIFCLFATTVAGMAQTLWTPYVGLSGLIFALFGLAMVWRRTDEWLQLHLTDEEIRYGLIWLVGGVILSALKIMPIGNACHFAGFFYGWLFGKVLFGTPQARQWKPVVLTFHVLLFPAFYFLMHPFWNALYHWHRGDTADNPAVRIYHYSSATYWNPEYVEPWRRLVYALDESGDGMLAWEWSLMGLRQHPTSQELIDVAQQLWVQIPNGQPQRHARELLIEIFGEQHAANWEKVLIQNTELAEVPMDGQNSVGRPGRPPGDQTEDPPEPPITLPLRALDEHWFPPRKLPPPNEKLPGSAEEGRAV